MVFPSTITFSDPGEPIFTLTGILISRSMSCFRLTACVLMSLQKKQRLISMFISSCWSLVVGRQLISIVQASIRACKCRNCKLINVREPLG